MKKYVGIAVAISLISSGALAHDRIELKPTSAWVLNYDDDSCALQRQFGEGEQQVYLELRQFRVGGSLQTTVGSDHFKRRTGLFKVAFEPVDIKPREIMGFDIRLGSGYEGKLFSYQLGDTNTKMRDALRAFAREAEILTDQEKELILPALDLEPDSKEYARFTGNPEFQYGLSRLAKAFERTNFFVASRDEGESLVEGISLDKAFDRPIFLRTGGLHKPMDAMRTCLDELTSHWGIDVEAHRTLMRDVEPIDYGSWARKIQESYPPRMIRQRMQGYLQVRLDVSADGAPTACHMQSTINDEEFEKVACATLMSNAKFAPALDAKGQAIASYYQTGIVYQFSY